MADTFDPAPGAAGFQTSTPSILSLATLKGSLESYLLMGKEDSAQQETPSNTSIALKKLRKKSVVMTAYLALLLKSSKYYVPLKDIKSFEESQKDSELKAGFTIITPENPDHRGAQLSVLLLPRHHGLLSPVSEAMMEAGVYGDEREPDVMRLAPVPLYNTHKECWVAAKVLDWAVEVHHITPLSF
jgi:kynureninase